MTPKELIEALQKLEQGTLNAEEKLVLLKEMNRRVEDLNEDMKKTLALLNE